MLNISAPVLFPRKSKSSSRSCYPAQNSTFYTTKTGLPGRPTGGNSQKWRSHAHFWHWKSCQPEERALGSAAHALPWAEVSPRVGPDPSIQWVPCLHGREEASDIGPGPIQWVPGVFKASSPRPVSSPWSLVDTLLASQGKWERVMILFSSHDDVRHINSKTFCETGEQVLCWTET